MKNSAYAFFWDSVLKKCQDAVAKGVSFYSQIETYLSATNLSKVEFSLGSRYLPRGYYCPSPDIEYIITNMHRGKIAKRLVKASKPTNFYMFNEENKIFLVETWYPNGSKGTEYILHEQNASYGFIYDQNGRVTSISVEEYADNKLCCYLWAACSYKEKEGYRFSWIINENLRYPDCGHLETDIYNVQTPMGRIWITRWKAVFDLDGNAKIIPNSRVSLLYEEEST